MIVREGHIIRKENEDPQLVVNEIVYRVNKFG